MTCGERVKVSDSYQSSGSKQESWCMLLLMTVTLLFLMKLIISHYQMVQSGTVLVIIDFITTLNEIVCRCCMEVGCLYVCVCLALNG